MPALPSGTVTLLFTDIEGSTQLQHQLRERYQEVVSEHRRLLEKAFAEHGGVVVDRQTESFFVVFTRARHATQAASDAQRAVAGHEWPDGAQVKVRMGIHSGDPELAGDRYVGLAVSRAARVCASAHGGQVLLSSSARALLSDHDRTALRGLGSYQLKDFAEPEPISQLVVDGLPSQFPPLRTEAAERRRRRLLLAAGGLLVAIAGAVVALTGVLRSSSAGGQAATPNSVAVIAVDSAAVEDVVEVGNDPGPIAFGEDKVWVANRGDQTLTRIDLESGAVEEVFGLGFEPSALAVGAHSVWVTGAQDGTLVRRNAATGELQKRFDLGPGGIGPAPVAFGAGSVWVGNGNADLVERIDPRTNSVVRTYGVAVPQLIAAGPEGVWVVEGADALVRLNPRGGIAAQIPIEFGAGGLALGADSVWVTDPDADQVVRFDYRTRARGRATRVGQNPIGVAFGAGAVWVANTLDGTVSEVDPERDEVADAVDVGKRLAGIAAAPSTVWVSVSEP